MKVILRTRSSRVRRKIARPPTMPVEQDASFLTGLVEPILGRLRYLAYTTRGEQAIEDLKGEACHVVSEAFREAVLSTLWARFGRFANPTMRFAAMLDQGHLTSDGDWADSPIAMSIVAPEIDEPEVALLNSEDDRVRQQKLASTFTEAVAYLRVLDYFQGDLCAIARHLATSVTVVQRLLSKAAAFAERQASLFDGIERIVSDVLPARLHTRVSFRRTTKP